MQETDVLIIGGGLTGLVLQYLLKGSGHAAVIVEARGRLGGRIWTREAPEQAGIDMGATWLGAQHHRLLRLLKELEVPLFPQRLGAHALLEQNRHTPVQRVPLPPDNDPSYRIQNGTSALIRALAQHLDEGQVLLNTPVQQIKATEEGIYTTAGQVRFRSGIVVSTLPPYLLSCSITLQPTLPLPLTHLMQRTHTWMGASIKAGLRYEQPFWRSGGSNGTAFSQVGPFTELYDHTDADDRHYALKGFLREDLAGLSREDRQQLVAQQLHKLFGPAALNYTAYEETVWSGESYTYATYPQPVGPHQNNGHDAFRQPHWDDRLFLAGSETAEAFPGYMEGAVRSAEWVHQALGKSPALS